MNTEESNARQRKAKATREANKTKKAAIQHLTHAADWCHDAAGMLPDRIDALDSIRVARQSLDAAEAIIRDGLPT